MKIITAVRGFKDILPGESEKWQYVENRAREIFSRFGFQEIRIPIVEKTELFKRGIGESTDIVEKEMYTFLDRGDESLTLRPEATASVMRAYLEHSLFSVEPVTKLFTIGPMFRRERPQKGRYRQFHQINVELLGQKEPLVDAEVIFMLYNFLAHAGLENKILEINTLGCRECRPRFRQVIQDFLSKKKEGLCEDCIRRLDTNPLRVFDCKIEGCRERLSGAPALIDFICPECRDHFIKVREGLEFFQIPYHVNTRMVRGLDYYTRTAFEVTAGSLGAQNAVAGGGRYDRLISDLGGPDTPGIGFAVGIERLISILDIQDENVIRYPDLFIAALGEEALKRAFVICQNLRMDGLYVEMDYAGKSLKSQMKRSDKLGSRFTLMIGDNEIRQNRAELKNMKTGLQNQFSLDHIEENILHLIKE